LEISTSETLFDPIEVVIDGKTFIVKEITLDTLEKVQDLYVEATAGSARAIHQILDLVLGKDDLFGKMTMRQLKRLVEVVVSKSLNPPEGDEKNASRDGEAGLP